MKILVFGRGVISTQYAWALHQAGHDITFFVRKGKASEYNNEIKLNILDARKRLQGIRINETIKVKMIEEILPNHDFDLIFLSLQHYHLKDNLEFLSTKMNHAKLLICGNLWEEPEELEKIFSIDTVVWGFPVAGGGFDKNDVLNGALFSGFTFGTFNHQEPKLYQLAIQKVFADAGFKISLQNDFRSYLYVHFILGAAVHLQSINSNSIINILSNPTQWKEIIKNGKELLPLLAARNVDFKSMKEMKLFNMPWWLIGGMMSLIYRYYKPLKASTGGHNNANELIGVLKDVIATADELNIELPRFSKFKKTLNNNET